VEKCQGSDLKPPPPIPFLNTAWTFVGSFTTLLALYGVSFLAGYETGETLVLAPFGALMTLQFSLTAAPASQPRNVVYGQLICLFMALLAKHYLIEQAQWPLWTVVPLTTAGGIAIMTKLSVTHPPAAASVVALFSMPNFTVVTAAILLAGNILAIIMAMLINNLSEKRRYPVYWEFGFVSTQESRGEQPGRLVLQQKVSESARCPEDHDTAQDSLDISDPRSEHGTAVSRALVRSNTHSYPQYHFIRSTL
jgi:CBS-domain-containing membrane protein